MKTAILTAAIFAAFSFGDALMEEAAVLDGAPSIRATYAGTIDLRVCLENDGMEARSLWLMWVSEEGEWERVPLLEVSRGRSISSGRSKVPKARTNWIALCDAHGAEVDDAVPAGPFIRQSGHIDLRFFVDGLRLVDEETGISSAPLPH